MFINRSLVVLACAVSIFAVGYLAHAQVQAGSFPDGQRPAPRLFPDISRVQPPPATIISGSDFGFLIDSYRAGAPVGTFVVRIDGQWMAVSETTTVKRLTSR